MSNTYTRDKSYTFMFSCMFHICTFTFIPVGCTIVSIVVLTVLVSMVIMGMVCFFVACLIASVSYDDSTGGGQSTLQFVAR